jgi:hypothetical protein
MRTDPANWSMVTWRIPADVGVGSGCLDVALPEKLVAHGTLLIFSKCAQQLKDHLRIAPIELASRLIG